MKLTKKLWDAYKDGGDVWPLDFEPPSDRRTAKIVLRFLQQNENINILEVPDTWEELWEELTFDREERKWLREEEFLEKLEKLKKV